MSSGRRRRLGSRGRCPRPRPAGGSAAEEARWAPPKGGTTDGISEGKVPFPGDYSQLQWLIGHMMTKARPTTLCSVMAPK